jgi:hypothetical protein
MKGILTAIAAQQLACLAAGCALVEVLIVLSTWLEPKKQGVIKRTNEKRLIYSVFVTHIAAGRAALSTRMIHAMSINGRHTSNCRPVFDGTAKRLVFILFFHGASVC